jgi:DNA ligase-1
LTGIRAVAKVRDENVEIFSRQGKPIEGLKDIEEELSRLPNGFYDGELLLQKDDMPSKDLYRETVTVVNSKNKYKYGVVFNIFDYINTPDFLKGYWDTKCINRKRFVYEELRKIEPDWLKPVEILYHGKYDKRIVQQELDKQIELEHEGVMVNLANTPYEGKRTKNILKVKAMQDCDLKIIGFEEGTGKNKGTLGAVIVDYKGFEVKVGSGFTDQDRDYFWANQKELLGRVITVQYFEETTNKKDNSLSLRFPVYLELREPGKEVSYY